MSRSTAMAGLVLLALACDASAAAAASRCVLADGPVRGRVALAAGGEARIRDGALELPDRVVTPCDGLPGAFPTAIEAFGGGLVVGFRAAGAYLFDGERFSKIEGLPADAVRSLAVRGDTVWLGTGGSGLWRWIPGRAAARFEHVVLGRREISALAVDPAGDLHVGAGLYGTYRVGRDGAVTRQARGVYAACFRERGGSLEPLPPGRACSLGEAAAVSGLPSPHVTALAVQAGRLLVGTFDRGLVERAPDGRFRPIPGSPTFINALVVDGDIVWVATPKGLYSRVAGGPVRREPAVLPSEHVNGLALAGDGTLWVATGQGLAGLAPDGSVRVLDVAHGLPSRIVYSVAVTEDGAVWAGTAGGAARFGPEGVTRFSQASGALTHDWVNALHADGETVVAGTYDAGVVRLYPDGRGVADMELRDLWVNPGGIAHIGGGRLVVATLGDGLVVSDRDGAREVGPLPSRDVTSAAVAGGVLWVGTRGGLWASEDGAVVTADGY
jgi:sugar lactone lactonase YvrE